MNIRFVARVATVTIALAALLAAGSPAAEGAVEDPPQIVHVPTLFAPFGSSIDMTATARCASTTCSMTLSYRTSEGFSGLDGTTYLLGTGPDFTTETMSATAAQAVPDGTYTRGFDGTIPASVVTTEGVDYYLRLVDGESVTHFPVVAEALGEPLGSAFEVFGYSHIEILSRPTLTHVPRVSFEPGKSIGIEAYVTASTGAPVVTMSYGAAGNEGRQTVSMVLRTTAVDEDGIATAWVASAAIPSSYTAAGHNIVYSLRVDDGFQTVTSPASKDNLSAEINIAGTLVGPGTITVSAGEHVVHPVGQSL